MKIAEKILELPPNAALFIWFLVFAAIGLFFKYKKSIFAWGDAIYNRRKKIEEQERIIEIGYKQIQDHEKTIEGLNETVEELQSKIEEYESENIEHWDVSKKYRDRYDEQQEKTMELLSKMSDAIDSLNHKLDQFQESTENQFRVNKELNDNRHKAELRDKIMRAYRLHKDTGKITRLEYEALEGLIQEYYAVKGNGQVKDLVEPAFYSWEVIDE